MLLHVIITSMLHSEFRTCTILKLSKLQTWTTLRVASSSGIGRAVTLFVVGVTVGVLVVQILYLLCSPPPHFTGQCDHCSHCDHTLVSTLYTVVYSVQGYSVMKWLNNSN